MTLTLEFREPAESSSTLRTSAGPQVVSPFETREGSLKPRNSTPDPMSLSELEANSGPLETERREERDWSWARVEKWPREGC